ncbi:DUF2399 domain-containing protein [Streptomyces sp. MB09-02B]|uniref:DUF2399 domain-containing protein n=1 Tax=Streptomyces sp. MB09-02B TaxID=3028667 RepID=UPI0039AF7967
MVCGEAGRVKRHVRKPIACTSGTLTAIDHVLLNLAHDSGVPITYAGDLDSWGHDIARIVSSRYTATITGMDHVIHRHVSRAPAGPHQRSCSEPGSAPHLPGEPRNPGPDSGTERR